MDDLEFWAEVKANLREAYASALHWQERARVAREQGAGRQRPRARLPAANGANLSDHRATGAMEGQACVHLLAG